MSDPMDPSSPSGPDAPGSQPTADPAAAGAAGGPDPSIALPPWSSLDRTGRIVAGGSIAAGVVLVVGGLLGAWPSTEFLVLALVAAVIAGAAAWLGPVVDDARMTFSVPGPLVALVAAAVLAVLGVLDGVELLWDLDQIDDRGGVLGAIAALALAVIGVLSLAGAAGAVPALHAAVRAADLPTRLALAGVALVLVGWALNLASYWTMSQATRSLVLVVVAALIGVLAGRGLPAIAAWVGAAVGLVAGLVWLDHWGQLQRLGEERLALEVTDYLPLLLILLGIVGVVAGGALAGMAARAVASSPTTSTGAANP